MTPPIKLRAGDAEDLKVIAACLQDAIVPISEMCYLPKQRRFVMVVNRFKWERAEQVAPAPAEDAIYERTNAGLRIDGVTAARRRNLDLRRRDHLLSILTVVPVAAGLEVIFAGGGSLLLETANWLCCLEDLGQPWPTSRKPAHLMAALDEPASEAG